MVERVAGSISMKRFPGPCWCLTPDAMAAVDRAAIEGGLPGIALMETAARSVADRIRATWPRRGRAVILVGGGNNGGDGLAIARLLTESGWRVEVALFTDPERLDGDAAAQWELVEPMGLPMRRVETEDEAGAVIQAARGATCVVDALLGTGLRGEVREPARTALSALDGEPPPVVAVDIPSGLDGEMGKVLGAASRATLTVTFGFPQPGHFLGEGPDRVGRLHVAPLGYPPGALEAAGETPLEWIPLADGSASLPPRSRRTHKGTAGRLLLVAGSERYRGAAVLAATAALRSGTGLCVVATPDTVSDVLLERLPEAIVEPLPTHKTGGLAARGVDLVARAAEQADAVAVGPGLTTGSGVRAVVEAALASSDALVLDADGLNVLAEDPEGVRRDRPTILTPHPGELGRWLGRPAGEVDGDRVDAAREAASRWEAIVVLKGSPTVVAEPSGVTAINLTGSPALAVGGSGDVLTGLMGSLLAQGVDPVLSARAAPLLHGLAGDRVECDLGERGVIPSDLLRTLPRIIRDLSGGRGEELLRQMDHPRAELLAAPRRVR